MNAKSVYVHLPFCKTKCPYCDFTTSTIGKVNDSSREKLRTYINALLNEIDMRCEPLRDSDSKPVIKTIFFGGGTPSLHSAQEIDEILSKLRKYFIFDSDIEITLEANPGTVNKEKLAELKNIGINRISIGAQTFDEKLLIKLARGHTVKETFEAVEDTIDMGFKSWSLDLIYGLPKQNLESWQNTISTALNFNPPHISAYALSIESGTPFAKIYKNSSHVDIPQEESLVNMYKIANERFSERKIYRYEISNWARTGHEAKHNLTYWRAEEYYAFGVSAHGYLNSYRYENTKDLKLYLDALMSSPIQSETQASWHGNDIGSDNDTEGSNCMGQCVTNLMYIDEQERVEEEIMLKLRLETGITLSTAIIEKLDMDKLKFFTQKGLINRTENNIKLSTEGMLMSNKIIAGLIS